MRSFFISLVKDSPTAFVILILGVILSLFGWNLAQDLVNQQAQRAFERQATKARETVQQHLRGYTDLLYGLKGLFAASSAVSRKAFRTYLDSVGAIDRYPSVKAIAFLSEVPHSRKAAFEQAVRSDTSLDPSGHPNFSIVPPGERARYLAVQFREPVEGEDLALGTDISTQSVRLGAAMQARDSGEAAATGPYPADAEDTLQEGFAIYVPVYRTGSSLQSVRQRRAAFAGVVGAAFDMQELMRTALGEKLLASAYVTVDDYGPIEAAQSGGAGSGRLLYNSAISGEGRSAQAKPALHPLQRHETALQVGGRLWHLTFTPVVDPLSRMQRALPTVIFGIGLALSVLLAAVVRSMATSRAMAVDLADDMTRDLRMSEARFRSLIENAKDVIAVVDGRGVVTYQSPAGERMLGFAPGELVGDSVFDRVHPDDLTAVLNAFQRLLDHPDKSENIKFRFRHREGSWLWLEAAGSNRMHDPAVGGVVINWRDITERHDAETELKESEEKFRLITENVEDLIVLVDTKGRRIYNNPAYRKLFYEQHLAGSDSFAEIHPEDRERMREILRDTVATGIGHRAQFRFLLDDGSIRHIESQGNVIRDAHGKVSKVVVISRDITDLKLAEAQMQHLAHHDGLTGLPNRLLLHDRIGQALVQANRNSKRAGLLFVDLDRFKEINDTHGHQVGDRMLQRVAERLKSCVREGDTVGRLGGDEFVVLLANIRDYQDARLVAGKVLDVVSNPYLIDSLQLSVTPSIGICVYPEDGKDVEEIMRNADTAMYHAKESGRANFQLFVRRMDAAVAERLTLEKQLHRALERGEFVLHYQPQIDTQSRSVKAVEALLRWRQESGELVYPKRFIGVAEETGLVVPIAAWALDEVCKDLRRWREGGLPHLRVAVNLSPRQFRQKDFASQLKALLDQHGLEPACLELEVTETVIMQHAEEAIAALRQVKELGVTLTIDDFGTGYSSLSYLKHFPVDRLKIDKLFVRDLDTKADDAAIVTAVIAMAHGLGLKVVAEGVENQVQLDFLRAHRCDEVQGSYFSAPLPAEDLSHLLASSSRVAMAGGARLTMLRADDAGRR
jgi:diguanylate cyclase (GGDEF)-like protein/PAS domain S-box-containing protein